MQIMNENRRVRIQALLGQKEFKAISKSVIFHRYEIEGSGERTHIFLSAQKCRNFMFLSLIKFNAQFVMQRGYFKCITFFHVFDQSTAERPLRSFQPTNVH